MAGIVLIIKIGCMSASIWILFNYDESTCCTIISSSLVNNKKHFNNNIKSYVPTFSFVEHGVRRGQEAISVKTPPQTTYKQQ